MTAPEAEDDSPVAYMARSRAWYLALGYDTPFRWAHHVDAPFARLAQPLAATRLALVTTAAPFAPGKGDQGPGAPYNAAAKFYELHAQAVDAPADMRISHIAYDRAHNRADDPASWFPLAAMQRAAAAGRFVLAPRFFALPTNRSRARSAEVDAPALLAALRADGVGAALLVPNCPVCHQCVALAARCLEAAGIATVIAGCAKDIVEHVGVPRFVFSDLPLGMGAGKAQDREGQRATLDLALELLESARAPRTTVQSPARFADGPVWKRDYMNPDRLAPEELARRRAENDRQKQIAAGLREGLR